jgi:erythritol transport system ATP-binding protein
MVGEKKKHFDYVPAEKGEEVLRVNGLTLPHENGGYRLNDVSFSVRRGEVIGIYGLLGAGRTELFKVINGVMRQTSGQILLNGKNVERTSFGDRMRGGMALVPEDRQAEGLVQMMSIQANMTLSSLGRNAIKPIGDQRETAIVNGMIEKLAIKVSDAGLPVTSLSGGNQQKVVLGKALLTDPQVVFLDEPTRGIDVGAKTDVYHLIGAMARQGLAVMFSSSELDEVMSLADRVMVMADGKLTADLPREQADRELLIRASTPHA